MKQFVLFALIFSLSFSFAQESTLFTLMSNEDTNIHFSNIISEDKDNNVLIYSNYYGGAGVGIGDFNNDGLPDIFFAGNNVGDKLYLNQGDFKFKDITKSAGIIDNGGWSTGVTIADVNGDGFDDIFVSRELYDWNPELRRNKLYINNGDLTFTEKAKEYGLDGDARTRHAVFFDYNNDGLIDLLQLNQPPNPGSYSVLYNQYLIKPEYESKLYENKGNGTFIDVTNKAGIARTGFPNGVTASDINNDGYTDLYIANDFYVPDFYYINNGDGTFTNIIDSATNHLSYYSMGVDAADINNDGLLDIMVVDMAAEDNFRIKSNMGGMDPTIFKKNVERGRHYQYMFNTLHLNNGNQTFSDIAQISGVSSTDWSWSNLIADFDNDGKKDIIVTNGILRDIRNSDANNNISDYITKFSDSYLANNPLSGDINLLDVIDLEELLNIMPSKKMMNYAFKNEGDYRFDKVTKDWGLDKKSFSNGSAYADFDNDGDLDIVINNINEEVFIYRNNSNEFESHNYLRIRLESEKNDILLGSKISIEYDDKKQFVETTNVRGIYSTSEQTVHFGMSDVKIVDRITIHWPDFTETIFKDIKTNQEFVVVKEKVKKIKIRFNKKLSAKYFKEQKINNLVFKHQENNFDDFKHQVLLPHKMSQFGPAIAVADVNNDGLEDVYLGASVGNLGKLFIQNSKGKFKLKNNVDFNLDISKEDLDAVFFDIDNDGDFDLYVVSGGNEYEANNPNYIDRLYLNDGNGNFSKNTDLLEGSAISGSVVKSIDYDNDGDIDLFIGGRHLPHNYPMPTDSRILENRNGKLVDVTKNIAPELLNLGMVTDAIWTDFDGDNDLDLIIVGEWMSITIFENRKGVFSKIEVPSLADTSGWWFSIEQGDFDNDGDMDYVAGNLGLNYKYKTSKEAPFDVYYKDFDDNGKKDIVLGYYNYGTHFPLRGFSCSAQQIPQLKSNIIKYDIFASLGIEEVYGKENLDEALHYETQTFASVYIENLGNGKFELTNLPVEAQFSSVNDFLVKDINTDGNLDVIMIGNLFGSEIETTRNDAGIGVVLLGDGANNFKSVSHQESGFFARGNAKKIKALNKKDKTLVLVVNNNDDLQVFEINK